VLFVGVFCGSDLFTVVFACVLYCTLYLVMHSCTYTLRSISCRTDFLNNRTRAIYRPSY